MIFEWSMGRSVFDMGMPVRCARSGTVTRCGLGRQDTVRVYIPSRFGVKFWGFRIRVAMDRGSSGTGWGPFGRHWGPVGMAWGSLGIDWGPMLKTLNQQLEPQFKQVLFWCYLLLYCFGKSLQFRQQMHNTFSKPHQIWIGRTRLSFLLLLMLLVLVWLLLFSVCVYRCRCRRLCLCHWCNE
jgi:hypothetical protein